MSESERVKLALRLLRKYHARIHSLQSQVNQSAKEIRDDLEAVEHYTETENYQDQGE